MSRLAPLMMSTEALADRGAFAERLKLQLASRYRGASVEIDPVRFALRVTAPGIDTTLPLSPLHNACMREPERAAALITEYVSSIERQLTPRVVTELSTKRLLWCVRTRAYLVGISRASDLLVVDIAPGLNAFAAEDLPGSIMRGVPREEWEANGLSDERVREVTTLNTAQRFEKLAERIRAVDRIPRDGWRMAGDPMYQGSILMVPDVLAALVQRSNSDVLIGLPDRGIVLAIPTSQPSAELFHRRVLREWREAMNPCSHDVLVTDGVTVKRVERRRPRAGAVVLPWLGE